jgi:sterol desaturase/sphingolipid hydroxylase (fatty acid hydroxylase superfamily)
VSQNALLGLVLIGWFVTLALAEVFWRPRGAELAKHSDGRLLTNFGLAALILLASAIFPLATIGTSIGAERFNLGIARHIAMPWLIAFALLLLLDSFATYWAHRLMHRTKLLWRVHRVHHSDNEVDISTSLRNHPLELLVTIPAATVAVIIAGAPVSAVVALRTLLIGSAIWQHADVALPRRVDRAVSLVMVTQRVHRLHHNPARSTHDSNYGEFLTLWDRLFGTFRPGGGRERVGLDDQVARPDRLLQQIWSPVYGA